MKKLLFILLFPLVCDAELWLRLDPNHVVMDMIMASFPPMIPKGWSQHKFNLTDYNSLMKYLSHSAVAYVNDFGKIEGFYIRLSKKNLWKYYPFGCKGTFE